jgi:hypothetical protein
VAGEEETPEGDDVDEEEPPEDSWYKTGECRPSAGPVVTMPLAVAVVARFLATLPFIS